MQDQPERAVKMLAKMREAKTKPDIRTYELLFSLFGNINSLYEKGNLLSHADVTKRINAIETDMLQNGIQHSQVSIKNLVIFPSFLVISLVLCLNAIFMVRYAFYDFCYQAYLELYFLQFCVRSSCSQFLIVLMIFVCNDFFYKC